MNFIKQITLVLFILTACNNAEIPKEKLFQFYADSKVYFKDDTICISLNNPLRCPLRYYISSSDAGLDKKLNNFKPVILQQKKDTVLKIAADSLVIKTITYYNILGDLDKKIIKNKIALPFSRDKSYKIIQGYNGSYSHYMDDYSRYAIDIGLKQNDTICAADAGFVVGVIKDYTSGGDDERLKEHANLITIYHPHSGLFTQYVHLAYNGSFVTSGDSVETGQPIGLSGKTGFTDVEHLHFNVLVPVTTPDGLNSVKITFVEGYEGGNLKRNDKVAKK